MPRAVSKWTIHFFCVALSLPSGVKADEAASNYLLAALELHGQVPKFVGSSTTDDPDNGFSTRLSDKQVSYLKQRSVASALDRFDEATSFQQCVWSRYSKSSWSSAQLNDHLHRLARVALLRARLHYESGRWIDGNQSVEQVRIMARHMALQARPFEHQCFMIENMANGTAAAYIFQFPQEALADLLARHRRLGAFSPKKEMFVAEVNRFTTLADDFENGHVTIDKLIELMDPYLATADVERRIREMPGLDAAGEIRCLASFLNEHSDLMEVGFQDAEQQIQETYRRHALVCGLVAAYGDAPLHDYRENTQGVCRSIMMAEVIQRLHDGDSDFAAISDPYGSKPFELRKHDHGFTLVSELRHHNRISWRFGLAGPK